MLAKDQLGSIERVTISGPSTPFLFFRELLKVTFDNHLEWLLTDDLIAVHLDDGSEILKNAV